MLPDRPSRSPDREALTRAIADLLLASGAELDAETRGTPERVAKAWIEDLLDGYGKDAVDVLKSSLVPAPKKGELVIVSQLDFHSMCPHHLLPYKGSAAVGYVADKNLVGFGKIAEAVDALAHRLILSVLVLQVEKAYFQCSKAVMRSGLWDPERRVERSVFPPFSQVLRDHCRDAAIPDEAELRASLARRAER